MISKLELRALFLVVLYIAVMALAMTTMHQGYGYVYGHPYMLKVLVYFEAFLFIYSLFALRHFNLLFKRAMNPISTILLKDSQQLKKTFGKSKFSWLVLPTLLITLYLVFRVIFYGNFSQYTDLQLLTVITTFFVGFSEEMIFRGILFRSLLVKRSVFTSLLISALIFSSLHSVNYFGGLPWPQVKEQMQATFFNGFLFAALYYKVKNLWIVIILHWLWDGVLFSSVLAGVSVEGIPQLAEIVEMALTALVIILLFLSKFTKKKYF